MTDHTPLTKIHAAPWPFGRKRRVAFLRLEGIIGSTGGLGLGRRLSMRNLESKLVRAFSLKRADAVVLLINSPGGSAVQSARLANRIRELARLNNRPVIAFVDDVAASGGYWLACAADEIYANPASMIGSIGVISASFGFTEMIDKLGIERRLHTAGRNKSMLDPFRPEDPEDVTHLKAIQEEIHREFIAAVRDRRGRRLVGHEEDLFSGRFWTGRRALELGLIDGVGDVSTILMERFGSGVRLVEITDRVTWWRRWFPWRQTGSQGSRATLAGDVADGLLARIEDKVWWNRFGL